MTGDFSIRSDESLALDAVGGDLAGFEELVRRYSGSLYEFAYSRMSNREDARDIVQETFLRIYSHLGSFDDRYSFKTWVLTIEYRLIISHFRKKKHFNLSEEASRNLSASKIEEEDYKYLWDAAKSLKGDGFTVLWLRYRQDMSIEKIAKVMGKTEVGIRVLLHRSRKQLGERLCRVSGEAGEFRKKKLS